MSLIPGSGRPPGEGNGNPLDYSFLFFLNRSIYQAVLVFIAAWAFLSLQRVGAVLWLLCTGFSLQWLFLLCSTDSLGCMGFMQVVTLGLPAHWLNSCGTWAQLPHSTCDLTRPGMKVMSSVLAGGFLSTGPPGKSRHIKIFKSQLFPLQESGFRAKCLTHFLPVICSYQPSVRLLFLLLRCGFIKLTFQIIYRILNIRHSYSHCQVVFWLILHKYTQAKYSGINSSHFIHFY